MRTVEFSSRCTGIIVALFAAIVALGLFMPLQTDEIAWGYQNHRGIVDGGRIITLLPQCHAPDQIDRPLPVSWYPHAWVNYLLFMTVDSLVWIRIIGIVRFLAFLGASFFIVKALAPRMGMSARSLFTLLLAVIALDPLPLLMQVNRPEQTLLLGSAIFIALALHAPAIARSKARHVALGVFVFVTLLVFPAHSKAITILPIAMACGGILCYRVTGSRILTTLMILGIAWFAAASVMSWLQGHQCPHSAITAKFIAFYSLPVSDILSDPQNFARSALRAFIFAIVNDFDLLHHLAPGRSGWLPLTVAALPGWLIGWDKTQMTVASCIRLFSFLCCLWLGCRIGMDMLKRRLRIPGLDHASAGIGLAALASLLGLMLVSGETRTFYHVALQAPLLWLCLSLLYAGSMGLSGHALRVLRVGVPVLLMLAAGNTLLLWGKYHPYITKPATRERLFGDRFLVLLSPWDYSGRKEKILKAYEACGFPSLSGARHLMIDDYTYSVLKHTYQPFHFYNIYLLEKSPDPPELEDLLRFMKEYNSPGFLVDCRVVPKTLIRHTAEHEGYCCLKRDALSISRDLSNDNGR